ncbi:MAG: hypothetical protein V5A45_10420 [Haloarculaceae archaeon]
MFRDNLPSLHPDRFVSTTFNRIERLVQTVAFWTATILPVGYLPLLALGPSRFVSLPMLGQIVSINALALLLGHGYRNESEDSEDADGE